MFHLPPKTIHRMQAISDCRLIEVSTPQLTDVVRLDDDYNRLKSMYKIKNSKSIQIQNNNDLSFINCNHAGISCFKLLLSFVIKTPE